MTIWTLKISAHKNTKLSDCSSLAHFNVLNEKYICVVCKETIHFSIIRMTYAGMGRIVDQGRYLFLCEVTNLVAVVNRGRSAL